MNPEDEAALKKSIADLRKEVDQHAKDVATLLTIGSPDVEQNCRTRYQENGGWARHYSTRSNDGCHVPSFRSASAFLPSTGSHRCTRRLASWRYPE